MKCTNKLLFVLALMTSEICSGQAGNSKQSESWVTNADRSAQFQEQPGSIVFDQVRNVNEPVIVVDPGQQMQSIDGFGFALTGGSAELLTRMNKDARARILRQLFATDGNSIGVSYLRLSIGSSDMNSFVFSYDDLPQGETDYELNKFGLAQDEKDVIPVLKEILAIAPDIKILASPWSAPAWMKTNSDVRGGELKKDCYPAYAQYLVKYVQEMKRAGIEIDTLSIQNEPLNFRNTPSMQWSVDQQLVFLRDYLYPSFTKAGLKTKVVLFDHNLDRIDYPLTLLSDPVISNFVDGSCFHYYAGDMGAMSVVHRARPDKNIYFTEQMTVESPGSPTIDIVPSVKQVILDTTRNWAKNVLVWNLAADPQNSPHTDNGGCSGCQGAITIDKDTITLNIAYYAIAHASKFVRPGSVRIASTSPGDPSLSLTSDEGRPEIKRATVVENTQVLPNVAFRTPESRIVLIVANDTRSVNSFTVQYMGKFARLTLAPGSVGTYVW